MAGRKRQAALACATALFALSLPLSQAVAEGQTWHDGWCYEGEGLTVVLDWSAYDGDETPTVEADSRILVRCIPLDSPRTGPYGDTGDAFLKAAGISFETTSTSFISNVNGLTGDGAPSEEHQWYWHLIAGRDGTWRAQGQDSYVPVNPLIDAFWGLTYTDVDPETNDPAPRINPQFGPTPSISPSPSPEPSGDGDGGDGDGSGTDSPTPKPSSETTAKGKPSKTATPKPTKSPKPKPSKQPTTTTTATPSTTPTKTPSTSARPSITPTNDPEPSATASPTPSVTAPTAGASPSPAPTSTPSPVWGQETSGHTSTGSPQQASVPRWSSLATLGGLGALVLGGLGFAIAALRPSAATMLEDE